MKNRLAFIGVILCALVVGLLPPAASAVTLLTINGTVTDPLGNPVQGAAVTDGSQTVYTNSVGRYALNEDRIADYVVSASKKGYDTTTRVVSTLDAAAGDINFALKFGIALTTSPQTFNNSPAKTIEVVVKSHAPPSACVTWMDISSSTTMRLSLSQAVAGGESTWSGQFAVPAGLTDGLFSHSASAADCVTRTELTRETTKTYTIDSAPPRIAAIAPADGGNTLFTAQPIVAELVDFMKSGSSTPDGSGVDPATVGVIVTESSGQQAPQTLATKLTGSTLRSTAASLVPGRTYEAVVSASDYAGNAASSAIRFHAMTSATIELPISISVAPVAASGFQAGGTISANDTYIWNDVRTTVGAFKVHLNETIHAGDGVVIAAFDPAAMSINYTINGVPGLPVRPLETTAAANAPYGTSGRGIVTVDVSQQSNVPAGRFTALVPKAADRSSVRLSLSTNATAASFALCSDPTTSKTTCAPDPLPSRGPRFVVQLPNEVAGGSWALSTVGGSDGSERSVHLSSGTVPPAGHPLNITVAASTLTRAQSNNVLYLQAAKKFSDDEAYVANVATGLTTDELNQGVFVDLGAPRAEVVTLYPTTAAAIEASGCSTCAGIGDDETYTSAPQDDAMATAVVGEGSTTPGPGAGPNEGPLPTPACAATNDCGTVVASSNYADGDDDCKVEPWGGVMDCIVSYKDTSVRSFRGYTQRIWGQTSRFGVESGSSNRWQIGGRVKAGPFEVNGSLTRKKETAGEDLWPLRGDCWLEGATSVHPCTNEGREPAYGNDNWRWEKHAHTMLNGCIWNCVYTTETLYNRKYIGGTEVDSVYRPDAWKKRPREIEQNHWGLWAPYLPGSSRKVSTRRSTEYSGGASVSVNFPESYGSATFSASVTNETYNKNWNDINFRADVPVGKWWWYDNNTDGRWEYWSCRDKTGWTTLGTCWSTNS